MRHLAPASLSTLPVLVSAHNKIWLARESACELKLGIVHIVWNVDIFVGGDLGGADHRCQRISRGPAEDATL